MLLGVFALICFARSCDLCIVYWFVATSKVGGVSNFRDSKMGPLRIFNDAASRGPPNFLNSS